MKEKITLFRDKEWSLIDGDICRVTEFVPMGALVKGGRVTDLDRRIPYASVRMQCKKFPNEVIGFITHKVDFINLWTAFRTRGIEEYEEVLIMWSTKHYKNKILQIFSLFLPKLWVMICQKGAFELITDDNSKPELRGDARYLVEKPAVDWKPDIMK